MRADHCSHKSGPNFFRERRSWNGLTSQIFGQESAPFCCKNASLPNRTCFTRIPPPHQPQEWPKMTNIRTKSVENPQDWHFRGVGTQFHGKTIFGHLGFWVGGGGVWKRSPNEKEIKMARQKGMSLLLTVRSFWFWSLLLTENWLGLYHCGWNNRFGLFFLRSLRPEIGFGLFYLRFPDRKYKDKP